MIDYMKSELYRLVRLKRMYVVSGGMLLLMSIAAFVLKYFDEMDPNFPYGDAHFYYSNVLGLIIIIVFSSFYFSLFLTRKNLDVIGQSLSHGYKRQTIFWSKFILQLIFFTLFCLIGIGVLLFWGQMLLVHGTMEIPNLLVGLANIAPVILGAFCLSYVLNLLGVSEVTGVIVISFVFILSENIFYPILRAFPNLLFLDHYFPSKIFDNTLLDFMELSNQFDPKGWISGIIIAIISLGAGNYFFNKKDI